MTGVSLDKNDNRVGLGERQYQVTVNVPAGAPWTVVSDLPWVTVSPASGTGPGTVTLTIAANATGAVREGTIRIAGRDHLIRQINGELFGEWVESLATPMRTAAAAPAGDGVANLLKYAFGLDSPLAAAHAWRPSMVFNDRTEIHFYRAPHRNDLTYVVRATDTLGTPVSQWPIIAQATAGGSTEPLAAGVDVVETALTDDLVEVKLALPPAAKSSRFCTVEVVRTDEEGGQ